MSELKHLCFGCQCQVPSCLVEQLARVDWVRGYCVHTYVSWISVLHVVVNQICFTVGIIRNLFNSLNTQLVLFKFIAVVLLSRSATPPRPRALLRVRSVKCLALPVSHISYGSRTASNAIKVSVTETQSSFTLSFF